MATTIIDQDIISVTVKQVTANEIPTHYTVTRPEVLDGKTYRIKSPLASHALYITINNILGNDNRLIPFEIFINSKDITNYQWVIALTRMISAIFRKGGDVLFILEELSSVVDPGDKGGYFSKRGKYIPSLVAELAEVLKIHFASLGLLDETHLDHMTKKYLTDKQQEYVDLTKDTLSLGGFPSSASLCSKCGFKSVIFMENCYTCLNCGDSKCG
jgi:hypothetical protein